MTCCPTRRRTAHHQHLVGGGSAGAHYSAALAETWAWGVRFEIAIQPGRPDFRRAVYRRGQARFAEHVPNVRYPATRCFRLHRNYIARGGAGFAFCRFCRCWLVGPTVPTGLQTQLGPPGQCGLGSALRDTVAVPDRRLRASVARQRSAPEHQYRLATKGRRQGLSQACPCASERASDPLFKTWQAWFSGHRPRFHLTVHGQTRALEVCIFRRCGLPHSI